MVQDNRIKMTILAEHAQLIFTYLSTRPFKEVANLMQILNHMEEVKKCKSECNCSIGFDDGKVFIDKN
jgi:hypothetical protein